MSRTFQTIVLPWLCFKVLRISWNISNICWFHLLQLQKQFACIVQNILFIGKLCVQCLAQQPEIQKLISSTIWLHTKKKHLWHRVALRRHLLYAYVSPPWVGTAGRCNTPFATMSLSTLYIWILIFFSQFSLSKIAKALSGWTEINLCQIGCWWTAIFKYCHRLLNGLRSGILQHA